MNRIADNGLAHGLRQHSIGGTYPALVVGRGSGSYEVHLGKHFCPRLTNEGAQQLAEEVAEVYRREGWGAAVRRLTFWNVRVNINS